MALFNGNHSNDMRYIYFQFPFDVNISSTAKGRNSHSSISESNSLSIYQDVGARVKHLHNFKLESEMECLFDVKLKIDATGSND